MSTVYFLIVVVLVLTAYFLGARKASGAVAGGRGEWHSLRPITGFSQPAPFSFRCCALYAIMAPWPRATWILGTVTVEPALVADPLQRGALMRDAIALATGQYAGAPTPELQAAANSLNSARTVTSWLILIIGCLAGLGAMQYARTRISPAFRARNSFEQIHDHRTSGLFSRRRPHHHRHCLFRAVRDASLLQQGFAHRFSLWPSMVAADRDPRRSGGFIRGLRHRAAGGRYVSHYLHCHVDCGPHRAVCRDLHG